MVKVDEETTYIKENGREMQGYYLNEYLKDNVDSYLIAAVKNKYDGVVLVSGLEGTGKTTLGGTLCKYVDPNFPGEPLNDGTARRKCTRIVYSFRQVVDAIDNAKPGEAILIDEAVISFSSQDASSDLQKALIKKFVTIRKKRLFIFIVIPSIFLLRKYFAIFRTRALIHCYSSNGIDRGYFAFFSHLKKRQLFIRGIKEFNQAAVKPDFRGRFTNTENFFYDPKEYDEKKEEAIKEITAEPEKKKAEMSGRRKKIADERNKLILHKHGKLKELNPKHTYNLTSEWLLKELNIKLDHDTVRECCVSAQKVIAQETEEKANPKPDEE